MFYDLSNCRCGVIQEGDRIIAVNGQCLEGRTMDEVYAFIAESPVKMILTVEFRVAGMSSFHCFKLFFISMNSFENITAKFIIIVSLCIILLLLLLHCILV